MYIGGTTLIALLTEPEERGRVQGIADMIIFIAVACASLSAGILHIIGGWQAMIFVAMIPTAFLTAVVVLSSYRQPLS